MFNMDLILRSLGISKDELESQAKQAAGYVKRMAENSEIILQNQKIIMDKLGIDNTTILIDERKNEND